MKLWLKSAIPIYRKLIIMFWLKVARLALRHLCLKDTDIYRMLKTELYP